VQRILYSSAEVRSAIVRLFSSSKGRRVAITAFVGDGAEAFLPKPEGLELICWPNAGATNPNAVRELIRKKVKVFFADAVHMKVYWTEDQGAVLTSANLSRNALGSGNLKEAGIVLPPGQVDIDRLLGQLKMREVEPSELRKLDRLHRLYTARNDVEMKPTRSTFLDWYRSPFREGWKLVWYEECTQDTPIIAQEEARNNYGISEPNACFFDSVKDYRRGDCILGFWFKKDSAHDAHWMVADFIVGVPRSDKKAHDPKNPYYLCQFKPSKYYRPPFRIDKPFRDALREAVRKFGASKIKNAKWRIPPDSFLNLISQHYGRDGAQRG
jgi:hypothetical protein